MSRDELLKLVEKIFYEVLKKDDFTLTYQSTANDIDGWDSLSNMKIIAQIEQQFKCRFNFREVLKFKNIGDLCDVLLTKLS